MEIQKIKRKLSRRQDISLDSAVGPDEKRLDCRLDSLHRARYGKPGIQVSAGSTAGE
jgi:hypothetical protein